MTSTPKKGEIVVVCKTNEEHLWMLVLIVTCQHYYRKFKKAKKSIKIKDVVAAARAAYNQGQREKAKDERSEIVWG